MKTVRFFVQSGTATIKNESISNDSVLSKFSNFFFAVKLANHFHRYYHFAHTFIDFFIQGIYLFVFKLASICCCFIFPVFTSVLHYHTNRTIFVALHLIISFFMILGYDFTIVLNKKKSCKQDVNTKIVNND